MDQRWYNKLQVAALKRFPCMDCGGVFPTDAMDFDHVRGIKVANISDLMLGDPEALRRELDKCELVCAVCHRIREMERRLDQHVDAALAADIDAALWDD